MLDLLAFDLDGTLADTETLKAESYGWAAHQLRPDIEPDAVRQAYLATCIGKSRQEIATSLLHRFDLEGAAASHDDTVAPWQSFVGLRLERYRAMLADVELVRRHEITPVTNLVRASATVADAVALVTTSDAVNAGLVLAALGLGGAFDAIVTSDDVAQTKPDPESYALALRRTGAVASRSVAIEDSPAGIQGAASAGLHVVAMPDRHTTDGVHALVRAGVIALGDVTAPETVADAVAAHARTSSRVG